MLLREGKGEGKGHLAALLESNPSVDQSLFVRQRDVLATASTLGAPLPGGED